MGNIVSYLYGDHSKSSKVFETKYGKISGRSIPIGGERSVNAFLGIPFAKPPIGELRFRKPLPPEPWINVRKCTKHSCRAPQQEFFVEKIFVRIPTSEDCLYLNVFAPDWELPAEQPNGRAVMIWIHGGGFAVHSAAHYGDEGIAKNLCSKEVIVITIQYRLGILGFSATGDSNSIPNLGLWDQMAALNWTRENIAGFGGDPNNITLFGQSAGAASVDMLSLSPYTRDLFSKAILMGGSADCDWAVSDANAVRNALIAFAEALGWKWPQGVRDGEVNSSLMSFLKNQPSSSLGLTIAKKRDKKFNRYGIDFVPIIDGDFLPEAISELRKKSPRKVYIAGVTEYEGLLFAAFGKKQYDRQSIERMINNTILPDKFSNFEQLRAQATQLYVKKGQSDEDIMRSYIRLFSDLFINNGVHRFCEEMTTAGHKVYLYNFEYCPASFGLLGWWFPFLAATHCTELPYLFGKGIIHSFSPNATDLKMLDQFTLFFTNFAKYGNPNENGEQLWQPLEAPCTWSYLSINETCKMKEDFHDKRAAFWNTLTPDLKQPNGTKSG
ncbi:Esterase CM06B1 [Toxocara canis]|uniref:Carboxylic ester hydrolase n=1 Tax=Toxocara canis TaxID=6265 RepID=A0A0B2VPN7_TOXCA|nr:Esterase CM06B1 [Toxocara canis]